MQGQVNGQAWNPPIPFNPSSLNTQAQLDLGISYPNQQNGYLYFGSGYDPNTNPDDYMYEPFFYNPTGGQTIYYGSAPQTQVDPNGLYGGLVSQTRLSGPGGVSGIQTPQGVQGAPSQDNWFTGPAVSSSTQSTNPWTSYMFGNNGDQGNIQGSFAPGLQGPTAFYQNEPASLNPTPQSGLGTFTPWNPSMQALQQSRSQP